MWLITSTQYHTSGFVVSGWQISHLRPFLRVLSLPASLTYPLLPSYWPFICLLNHSEGASGR